jgi:hypothetical protein
MAVRVERVGSVVDTGMKLRRNFYKFDSVLAQKTDRLFELAVIGDLQPERGALRMAARAEPVAQRQWKERERVMLGIHPQKQATMALPNDLFRQRKAEVVPVKRLRGFEILDEKTNRTEPDDFEGAGQ